MCELVQSRGSDVDLRPRVKRGRMRMLISATAAKRKEAKLPVRAAILKWPESVWDWGGIAEPIDIEEWLIVGTFERLPMYAVL